MTDYVNEQLKTDDDPNGTNYLSPKYLKTVADRFAKSEGIALTPGRKLELKAFYGGNRYYLFVKTTYSDIRMVGASPLLHRQVRRRHRQLDVDPATREISPCSASMPTKTGNPPLTAKTTLPLKVKKHLTISLDGYREGDFTFVMGFPGRNWRYMISDEVEERMQTTNFMRHHVRDVRQKALMKQMLQDDAVRIHYASKYASSANYWKNAIGMNEGLVRLKVLDTKRAQQEALLARGRSLNDNSYQQAFDQIRAIVKQRRPALYHQQAIQEALVTGLDFMRIPSTAGLVSALKNKDKKQIAAAKDSLQKAADRYFASVPFPEVERIVGKEMLKIYMKYIPAEQRIGIFQIIDKRFKGNSDAFIDACFEHSIFGNKENFAKFIRKPSLYKINTDWMVLLKYSITDGLLQTSIAMMDANKTTMPPTRYG